MATIEEAKQQLAQQQQQIQQRQQQLEAARRATQSQMALRSQSIQQRQIKAQELTKSQATIAEAKKQFEQNVQQVSKAEEEQRKVEAYNEGVRLAQERRGGVYLKDHDPETMRGYNETNMAIAAEEARYGGAASTLTYGTAAEKARISSQLGIPSNAKDVKVDVKTGEISYGVPGKTTTEQDYADIFVAAKPGEKYEKSWKDYTYPEEGRSAPVTGTLAYLGAKTEKFLSKSPALAEKPTIVVSYPEQKSGTSYYTKEKGFYTPEGYTTKGLSVAEFGGMTVQYGPWFIPVVREALAIGAGTETILSPKASLGEKALGTVAIAGGAWGAGMRTGIIKSEAERAINLPKETNVKMELVYDTSMNIKNIPKGKIFTIEATGKNIPKTVKSGTVEETRPINPRVVTSITSPTEKGFKISEVAYESGAVEGVITREARGKGLFKTYEYRTEYTVTPEGKATYNIFKDGKPFKQIESQAGKSFGFTEPIVNKNLNVRKTAVLPGKIKVRTINNVKTYSQELVPLKDDNFEIVGELKSGLKTESATILTPAKQNINFRKLEFNPKRDILLVKNVKKLTGKFAKSSPPDTEIIKAREASVESQKALSIESQTPRFRTITFQMAGGKGEFTINRPSLLERYARSNIFKSKRGQSLLNLEAPSPTMALPELQTGVAVPAVKIGDIGTSQIKLFLPKVISREQPINAGALSLFQKQKMEQIMQYQKKLSLEKVQTLSKVNKQFEFTRQTPKIEIMQQTMKMQKLKQLQEETQTGKQIQRPIQTPRKTIPRINPPKEPIPPIGNLGGNLRVNREKVNRALFEIYSRRKKKNIKIGTATTKEEAEFKLKSYLAETLAASGKIYRNKIALSVGELNLGKGFTPSKKESTRVVQAKGYRLGSYGERKEIKQSRRKIRVW